jgi:hypothetical protein
LRRSCSKGKSEVRSQIAEVKRKRLVACRQFFLPGLRSWVYNVKTAGKGERE